MTEAVAVLVAVFVFFSIFGGENFLSTGGAASWLNVASELGIIALPIGLLMIAGQLDLSVGWVLPACSMTIAIVSGAPIIIGILASLGLGLAIGFVNGLRVVRTKLPSFVVTLATLFAVAGLTLGLSVILTGSTSVALTSRGENAGRRLYRQQVPGVAVLVGRRYRDRRLPSELFALPRFSPSTWWAIPG